MMRHAITLLSVLLLLSCSHQQDASKATASSPFAKVVLSNTDAKEAELYLVVDRVDGGAEALDAFVAKHAPAALREAERHNVEDLTVIFFFRDGPTSDFGSWGGFSIAELKQIVLEAEAGRTFRSVQAWPSVRFQATGDARELTRTQYNRATRLHWSGHSDRCALRRKEMLRAAETNV